MFTKNKQNTKYYNSNDNNKENAKGKKQTAS